MTLVERTVSFVESVVAVIGARHAREKKVRAATALIEVDRVRPGISDRSLQPVRVPLLELHSQRFVVSITAVLILKNPVVFGIRFRALVNLSGIRADLVSADIVNP